MRGVAQRAAHSERSEQRPGDGDEHPAGVVAERVERGAGQGSQGINEEAVLRAKKLGAPLVKTELTENARPSAPRAPLLIASPPTANTPAIAQVIAASTTICTRPRKKSDQVKPARTVLAAVTAKPVGQGGIGKSKQSSPRSTTQATPTALSNPPGTLTVPEPNSCLLAEASKMSGSSRLGQMWPGCGPESWVRPIA